jgi:predicted transcriptional regulator
MPHARNMSDEGDIPDILLSQIAEMMECEAKAPDISHMDFLYDEIDDI